MSCCRKRQPESLPPPSSGINAFTNGIQNSEMTSPHQTQHYHPCPPTLKNWKQIPSQLRSLLTHLILTALPSSSETLPPSSQTRIHGMSLWNQTTLNTNQSIGPPSPNLKRCLKSIGPKFDRLAPKPINPFHPQVYSARDRVTIDLIETSHQGLLQDHPATLDPVPTFTHSLVPSSSPLPITASSSYQTLSPSVDEGGPTSSCQCDTGCVHRSECLHTNSAISSPSERV